MMSIDKKYLDFEIIKRYKSVAIKMLQFSFPELDYSEIGDAVDYSLIKRMKNGDAVIRNNYKNKEIDIQLIEMAEYIIKREPIITSYGVMFKKHDEEVNPIAKLLQTFMNNRNIFKKEMFKYTKGSELYERYNLLQLLAKIDAKPIAAQFQALASVVGIQRKIKPFELLEVPKAHLTTTWPVKASVTVVERQKEKMGCYMRKL